MPSKSVLGLILIVVVFIAVAVGIRFTRRPGVFHHQVATVKPGEYVTVNLDVNTTLHIFGYRIPLKFNERKSIVGVTLHDYESGKLIGRFHDAGVKLCPHCNGVGEVKEEE